MGRERSQSDTYGKPWVSFFMGAPVLGQFLDENEAFSPSSRLQKTDLVDSIYRFYLACVIVFRNFITMNG